MISIGRKKGDRTRLNEISTVAHVVRTRVQRLDLDHNYLEDLSDLFTDGSVTVDEDAEITRALDLVLTDPAGRVHFDGDSPTRSGVFITNMIKITYIVADPLYQDVFPVPIFCGPVDDLDREGVKLTIKCLGKESLSNDNAWRGKTYREGMKKTDVIRDLLEQVGETKFDIPDLNAKLPNDLKLNKDENPWQEAKKIARSLGYQLFYDGRGYAVMRSKRTRGSVHFNASNMTSYPKIDYDLSKVINAVRVIGKKPKKSKTRIKYTAIAPRSHPLSPKRLGRHGKRRYLWMEISDDKIDSKSEAKKVARTELKRGLLAGTKVTFNGLVQARAQEGDVGDIRLPNLHAEFKLSQFTIPLVVTDEATYGYLKRARPLGGKGKRKGHKHSHGGRKP